MQNLTIDEIVANIKQGSCFEATHEGNFYIKIQEYKPFLCAAIHDGHRFRKDLEEVCLLTDEERYYEEDPFTGDFIQSLPITLIGGDSRYEYDLNRDENNCIYDVAWGKKVWKKELTAKQRETSLKKYRDFYLVLDTLIEKLEQQFGACLVYDIHSYNYMRHERSYVFNVGIENVDIKRFNTHISHWKKQLVSIKNRRITTDVSVNHIFQGNGYLLIHITKKFKNTLVMATEIKKIFMNELTGQPYPVIIQTIAKGMKNAILNDAARFANEYCNIKVKRKARLLNSDLQPELIKLDKELHQIVKNFEILGYVNPMNIEAEKKKFFRSNFSNNPAFKYRPLMIDPHVFKSKMYRLDVDVIEDVHIRQIYVDIINAYADKVDMLSTLGTENFLYNSLRYFGEPSESDMANANFLLYCEELPQFKDEEMLPSTEVKKIFLEEGEKYGFKFKVEVVSSIPSDALVINSKRLMQLKKGAMFTPTRLKALLNHEIGVHMVTTMNAQEQPLRFLSLGLPKNTYTQEGLAIMSEYYSGCLTVTRLKELGLRVQAVKSLTKGNDFKTTFNQLYEEHKVDPDKLFYLVTRVYRGGGFTKDYLYMRGFRRVLQMTARGTKMDNLFLGKTNHHYLPILNELVDRGILNKPKYQCFAFTHPVVQDPIMTYLTEGIK